MFLLFVSELSYYLSVDVSSRFYTPDLFCGWGMGHSRKHPYNPHRTKKVNTPYALPLDVSTMDAVWIFSGTTQFGGGIEGFIVGHTLPEYPLYPL
jgi:hypothetical protein